jgi:hypothetical protein
MLNYSRQVAICEAVRETIKKALIQSEDVSIKLRVSDIPTTDSILRAASVLPSIDTEEQLKGFIIDDVLASLHIATIQKEQINLNG